MTSPGDPRSDEDLVAAANGGDVAAFEALYRRHRDWVVRLAFRFTGDHDSALDVLQETFSYLLRKFPGLVLTGKLTTLLYPVVRHTALHSRRKARRAVPLETTTVDPPAREPERPGTREELAAVLRGLSEEHRETLLLRFVDGLSLEEIARTLGIPTGTVKSRLHNALQHLREDPRTRQLLGE
ncbi:MAG: RNA polymerase sigma factor [Planctomycetales bacterium]|nr:RNA polymerase sigma factor [Planctomycetales bacterium]